MIPFNYHHLYYFYVTAKAGSISKACETLLLSQPAVSTQLKQLGKEFGSPLFVRRKQRLQLTETGRIALDYAERIFDLGRELSGSLSRRDRDDRAAVRVGILSGAPRAYGHLLLACILEKFPMTRVMVREGAQEALISELREQTVDLLLTDASVHEQGPAPYTNHLVGKVPIVFAAAPALARRHPRLPRDLNGAPFILPGWSPRIRAQILALLTEWEVAPKVVAEVSDPKLARRLAVSGLAIAPVSAYALSADPPPGSLTVLKVPKSASLHDSIYLVSRPRRWPHPVVAHVMKSFRLPPKAG